MAFNTNTVKETRKPTPLVYGINSNGMILLPYFNLDNAGKSKLGLRTGKKEPKYILKNKNKETGEEYDTLMCELYVKVDNEKLVGTNLEELNKKIFPITFFVNNVKRSIGKNSGKYQYINKIGQTAWLFDENDEKNMKWWEDAKGNINKEDIRITFEGEGDFMEAIGNLSGFSRGGYETFNWKKLFAEDFSEIRTSLKEMVEYHRAKSEKTKKLSEPRSSVLFYIKESEVIDNETGDSTIYYNQRLWNKKFTPNAIRKELKRMSTEGYELKGIYQKNNVVTNYLNEFTESNNFTSDTSKSQLNDEQDDDLPF